MAVKNTATIAITGANGFLGSRLVAYFSEKGWHVVALVRNPDRHSPSKNVTYAEYNLCEELQPILLRGVDYVVHTAYIKQDYQNPDAYASNVAAAQTLLSASRQAGVKRNVFISSMSAHDGAISSYGKQKLAIEKLFDTDADVSLRPGLIIGNGGLVKTMADFMKSKHIVPLVGGGRQPLQTVNVNDLGPAIERAIDRNVHGVLTIAHPHIYTYKQFYGKLAKSLDVRVLFVPIPLSGLLFAIRTISVLHIPLSVNSDNVLGLKKLIGVDNKQDLQKLGIKLDDLDSSLADAGF